MAENCTKANRRSKHCRYCGTLFYPRPQDYVRQTCCAHHECRLKAERERKNRSYQKRYQANKVLFRADTCKRVARHRHRQHLKVQTGLESMTAVLLFDQCFAIITGMALQMGGHECDPVRLLREWLRAGVSVQARGGVAGALSHRESRNICNVTRRDENRAQKPPSVRL